MTKRTKKAGISGKYNMHKIMSTSRPMYKGMDKNMHNAINSGSGTKTRPDAPKSSGGGQKGGNSGGANNKNNHPPKKGK